MMAIGSQRQHANDARRRAAAKRFGAVLAVIAAVVAACGPEVARGDEAGGGSPAGGGATLRIACFNAENLAAPGEETRLTRFRFEPARRRHLEKVAAVIETLVPDILVMPEVVSAAGVDAVVRILHEKGLADYRGYHVDGRDKFSGFDVAVVSRIRPDTIDGESIHLYVPSRSQGRDDEQWLQQTMTVPAPDGDEAETAGGREGRRGGTVVLQRHAAAFFTVHGRKIGVLGVHLKSNPSSVQSNAQRSAETIKLHHNVGGLPEDLEFELVEPLRDLFKDEVRQLGLQLGLPERIVWRHPFPGPGLAVRCLGEVTKPRLDKLREADAIVLEEIERAGLMRKISQAFAVLLPVQSVGVMGDARTYDDVLAVRAVETEDFMTADWSHMPHEVLARISSRVINEVRGINRVVYDISSKPPATIEWE